MRSQCVHGFPHGAKEPAGHDTTSKSTAGLRNEIEARPRKYIRLVKDDEGVARAIQTDTLFDSWWNCDGGGKRVRLSTGDRENRHAQRPRSTIDSDNQTGTRFSTFSAPRSPLVAPEEIMADDLTGKRFFELSHKWISPVAGD
jgi:hypothetical protein